jgi:hypothetical protein
MRVIYTLPKRLATRNEVETIIAPMLITIVVSIIIVATLSAMFWRRGEHLYGALWVQPILANIGSALKSDYQQIGDLLVGRASPDQSQHLQLARCQHREDAFQAHATQCSAAVGR